MRRADVALNALLDAKKRVPDQIAHPTDSKDSGPDDGCAIARREGGAPGHTAGVIHDQRQDQECGENREAGVEDGVAGGEEALMDLAVIMRAPIQKDATDKEACQEAKDPNQ